MIRAWMTVAENDRRDNELTHERRHCVTLDVLCAHSSRNETMPSYSICSVDTYQVLTLARPKQPRAGSIESWSRLGNILRATTVMSVRASPSLK